MIFGILIAVVGFYLFLREFFTRDVDLLFDDFDNWRDSSNGKGKLR